VARREKVVTAQEAVEAFLEDGVFLGVGGMHMHNNPMAMVREVARQKVSIRTLTTSPSASINADLLIGAGLVEEVILSYIGFEHLGLAPNFRRWAEDGKLRVRECDEAFVVYGYRAGASGIPFTPLPKGLHLSDVSGLNPDDYRWSEDPFSGERVLCARAIQPEVGIVHCQKADAYGNGIMEGSRFTDTDMARASDVLILQVEEVVPNEYIQEHAARVAIPAMLVDAVVPVPFGCHPTSSHRYYRYDEDHLKEYLAACKEGFDRYLEEYVSRPKTNEEYLEAIGGRAKVDELMEGSIPW
jgi:glutaconate CoA-transferase subunit A